MTMGWLDDGSTRCVVCVKCGATEPGNGSQWQNNYTQCGPCWSATTCPLCLLKYKESELVILCVQCERWMHGMCDQISSEEDAERCAEYGYNCPYCRPKDELPPHLLMDYTEPLPVPVKQKPTVPQFYMDGVYLSETGIQLIKALTIEQPKRQRARRPRQPSGGQPAASQGSTTTPPQSSLSTGLFGFRGRLSTEDSEDGSKDLMDVDVEPKMEVDEETKLTSEEVAKQDAESELKKKRQRKLQKLGIGGFVAKARSRSVSAKEQDVTLPLAGAGETSSEAALAALSGDVVAPAPEPAAEATGTTAEKPKRRRRVKKKNPLEDSFPLYLQEAFFGQSLLAASKTEQGPDMPSEDDEDSAMGRSEDNSILVLETSQGKSEDARIPSDSGAPSPALHTVGGSKRESPALHDDGTCTPIKHKQLKVTNKSRKAFRGPKTGRYPQVEAALLEYIKSLCADGCAVSIELLRNQARIIARKEGIPAFKKTGISNALDGTEDDVVHKNDKREHAEAGDESDDAAMSDVYGSLDSGSE
ncbi:hypothetical protein HPB51_020644 [Rhipicephalus microplus]|uniref:PHD-type domain-containing protein n=1 Tax=Rhipicephalus microplus TaxID=6941 RepID=A0A9J6DPG6_RHIMP|nr:hypothetical protein HPB51_020644 [Rhipicephalus microplus]